jgi:hypothetical protein
VTSSIRHVVIANVAQFSFSPLDGLCTPRRNVFAPSH